MRGCFARFIAFVGVIVISIEKLSAIRVDLAMRQPRKRAFDRAMRLNASGGTLGRFGEPECVDKVASSFGIWNWIIFAMLLLLIWLIVFCVVWLNVGNLNVKLGSFAGAALLSIGLLILWVSAETVVYRGFFMIFHPLICD